MALKIFLSIFICGTSIPCHAQPWIFWKDSKDGSGKYYRAEKFFKSGVSNDVFFQDTLLNFHQKQKVQVSGKTQLVQSIVFMDEVSCSGRSVTRSSGTAFSGEMGTGYELGKVYLQSDQAKYVFSESDWETKGFKARFCKSILDFLR